MAANSEIQEQTKKIENQEQIEKLDVPEKSKEIKRKKVPEDIEEFDPDTGFKVSKSDGVEKSLIITMANMMILNMIPENKGKSEFVNKAIQEYAANHYSTKIDSRLFSKEVEPPRASIQPFYKRLFAIFGAKLLNPDDLRNMLNVIKNSDYLPKHINDFDMIEIAKVLSKKSNIHKGKEGRPYWAVALNLYKYGYNLDELLNDSAQEPHQQLDEEE